MQSFEREFTHAAQPSIVFERFVDADFLQRQGEALGSRNVEVLECARSGNVARTVVRQVQSARAPGPLRKILPESLSTTEHNDWTVRPNDLHESTWTVDLAGAPVSLRGVTRIGPDGEGGTRVVIRGEIDVRVPVIGGKAEGMLVPRLAEDMAERDRYLREDVSGDGGDG